MRTALITGATSGIGEATARRFGALGYRLILTGRRSHRLEAVKRAIETEHKTEILALSFDIRERTAVERAIAGLPNTWKQIDILVNNAGLAAGLEHIDEGDPDDWERMIDTNVKGLLYITRQVAPLMIASGGGHIVNIGSIAGRQTYENGAVYCASKHAVNALSQGMRIDLLKHGIKVSQIRPGMVDTEFSTVRFHGDKTRADAVYKGITPLTGDDIARVVEWIATLPPHININDIEVMPDRQADAFYTWRGN
ncbi:SDR family NAD(P)-dependent oxidoreductase [Rikenella microfusus]|uniref:NADP-dependent 3-hydroxy acid dehydrogenase YdfG n=1 Tax=Rikenella microfusus TaxID=28139 RepID=A0A379MQP7_9BACT|nr:SDR family NAD(P)-dependent oxidoreductase [Rikenella microfusus]SUE33958.1 NADP-dependent 3-hydroxy acid dehydrogenase YdfG [Rikenella microfusus]